MDQRTAGRTVRPAGPGVPAGPVVPGVPALRRLTQHGEPACDGSIHLIQDENDHQVDDGRRGFDGQLHVAACDGIGAHVEGGLGRDPVKNDSEHDGKRNADLWAGA